MPMIMNKWSQCAGTCTGKYTAKVLWFRRRKFPLRGAHVQGRGAWAGFAIASGEIPPKSSRCYLPAYGVNILYGNSRNRS
jgi:hypothetical protein